MSQQRCRCSWVPFCAFHFHFHIFINWKIKLFAISRRVLIFLCLSTVLVCLPSLFRLLHSLCVCQRQKQWRKTIKESEREREVETEKEGEQQEDWDVRLKVGSIVRRFVAFVFALLKMLLQLRPPPSPSSLPCLCPCDGIQVKHRLCHLQRLAACNKWHLQYFNWISIRLSVCRRFTCHTLLVLVCTFSFSFHFHFRFPCHLTHSRQTVSCGRWEQDGVVSPVDCDFNEPARSVGSYDLILPLLYLTFLSSFSLFHSVSVWVLINHTNA